MAALALAVVLAIGTWVLWNVIRKARERQAAQERLLLQNGFRACNEDAKRLEEVVRSLRDSSDLEVSKPWKRSLGDTAIYWYEVGSSSRTDEQRSASEEFLCSFQRRSEQPYVLYLRPPQLGSGFGASLIEKMVSLTTPAGLQAIDLPPDIRSQSLFAAYGPKGTSLQELLDDQRLALLAKGAEHGIYAIRGRGEHCAMEFFGAYARKALQRTTWQETLSFVQRACA